MKVVKIKDIEDCFDGTFIKEVFFDTKVSSGFIHYLGQKGQLQYFPNFAKPFYKFIEYSGRYTIKGIQGNLSARIILSRKNVDNALREFNDFVASYTKS